ncbi:MAG: type II toxin-antitoxin system RelE/ParE family toxin [Patescibacteria group bacterium]
MEVSFFNPKIKEQVLALEKPSSTKVFRYIRLLALFGYKLGMPYSKQLANNLYELRVRGRQEVRLFYCFHQDGAVIVHIFVKKSQKTPSGDIETAVNRINLLTAI